MIINSSRTTLKERILVLDTSIRGLLLHVDYMTPVALILTHISKDENTAGSSNNPKTQSLPEPDIPTAIIIMHGPCQNSANTSKKPCESSSTMESQIYPQACGIRS